MERIGNSLAVMEDNLSELQESPQRKKTNVQESFVGFAAVKDTAGQGLADKPIEVIEKNLGLEVDSERRPSFNPGEKT